MYTVAVFSVILSFLSFSVSKIAQDAAPNLSEVLTSTLNVSDASNEIITKNNKDQLAQLNVTVTSPSDTEKNEKVPVSADNVTSSAAEKFEKKAEKEVNSAENDTIAGLTVQTAKNQTVVAPAGTNATAVVDAVMALLGQLGLSSLVAGANTTAAATVVATTAASSLNTTKPPICDISAVCNMFNPCPAPCVCSNVQNPKISGRCSNKGYVPPNQFFG